MALATTAVFSGSSIAVDPGFTVVKGQGNASATDVDAVNTLVGTVAAQMRARTDYGTRETGLIAAGTTAGKLKTLTNTITFAIAGRLYSKAPTDDLFDLSALGTVGASLYKAVWLYLDSSGAATVAAGTTAASEVLAIAALPAQDLTKSVIGVYVGQPSSNFANALTGTIINGFGAAVTPSTYTTTTYLSSWG